jgi:hypothetical protein
VQPGIQQPGIQQPGIQWSDRGHFVHELPCVESGLVEIGNFRSSQTIQRLLKLKNRLERITLVGLGFEDGNAGFDHPVLSPAGMNSKARNEAFSQIEDGKEETYLT